MVVEFLRKIAQAIGEVTLLHGTDLRSAQSLVERGISPKMLARLSGGAESFWAISDKDMSAAWTFAQANPRGSDEYGVVAFQLPAQALAQAIKAGHVIVDEKNWEGMRVYEFMPAAFGLLNSSPRSIARQTQEALVETPSMAEPVVAAWVTTHCKFSFSK